jgi:uncharacterized protein
MTTARSALSFMEGASPGRNEWWRYGLAVALFMGGYLGGAFLLIFMAGVGHGILVNEFPDQFTARPFMDLFDMNRGWPDALVMSGAVLFATVMGSVIIAIPALALAVKLVHQRPIFSLLGVEGFDWKVFRSSFLGAALGFALFTGAELVLFWEDILFSSRWRDLLVYLPVAVVVVPLQVLAEEVVFRGYLLQSVAVFTNRTWVRISIPALAFALLHFGNAEVQRVPVAAMSYFVIFSFYVTWLTARSGGIAAAVGFHLAMNVFAAFIISSSLSAYISPTLFYVDEPVSWLLPVEIIFIIAVYHSLMKRWNVIS